MKAEALQLRPTQFAVGMREVAQKTEKLRALKDKERHGFLHERPVPVVAWEGFSFIIDHHHLVRACWECGVAEVVVETKADLSHLSESAFWAEMGRKGWSHLYDQFGKGPHDGRLLPEDVRGLADDPYRSLAWAVRREGGYDKTGALFSDFRWADFLRGQVRIGPGAEGFKAAVAAALALARTPAARGLPGFEKTPAR